MKQYREWNLYGAYVVVETSGLIDETLSRSVHRAISKPAKLGIGESVKVIEYEAYQAAIRERDEARAILEDREEMHEQQVEGLKEKLKIAIGSLKFISNDRGANLVEIAIETLEKIK